MDKPDIILTDDGSHSLRIPSLKENYHSTHGAINESMHVFIEAGFRYCSDQRKELNILEIGFGTGLNALLTLVEAHKESVSVSYMGLEAYPLEEDLWSRLNYPALIDEHLQDVFRMIHKANWGEDVHLRENFTLIKIQKMLQDYEYTGMLFDLIYFDAFGPDVQAEMWTEDIFLKLSGMTKPGGVLVTYSCKGAVRRALKAAGYAVEKIPGPKGKREMARGVKF